MKSFLPIIITIVLTSNHVISQTINTCLGTDKTICSGQTVEITDCTPGNNIIGGITLNTPTSVPLSDDVWSSAINLGFSFSYFGVSYNQCIIGSNGLVSFNIANAGGYCPYSFTLNTPLPDNSVTGGLNSIMISYQDINPANNPNAVQYQTIGTAPNRMFVVLYSSVDGFSCGATGCTYSALILYETSNNIEIHIGKKVVCEDWNDGLAYEGIQNSTGTNASMVNGRNGTQWSALQDAYRWTPTTPSNTNNYTNAITPYFFINSTTTNTTMWANTLGDVFPYNNGVLNVTQTQTGPIGYYLSGTACSDPVGSISDTTFITIESPVVTTSILDDPCGANTGSVTATPVSGTAPYTFLWPTLGNQVTPTVNNVGAGTYSVTMTSALGCTATSSATVSSTPLVYTSTTTPVSCPNGSDGTATAIMTPNVGNLSYLWDDPLMQTTQTATNLIAGTYNCTITTDLGCTGTTTATVTEILPLTLSIINFNNANCYSINNGTATVSATGGTQPYTYLWNNSLSTANTATDLPFGLAVVTVLDNNGCSKSISQQINQPQPLSIQTLTPSINDTICNGTTIPLTVSGQGGSSPYIFVWTENGNIIGTGDTINVTPPTDGTIYCVTLAEECGSPSVDSCLTINFPTDIIPIITPKTTEACAPSWIEFDNLSVNSDQIQSIKYNFGNGNISTINSPTSISNEYLKEGEYTLSVNILSKYGCEYNATFPNIVLLHAVPHPDFFIDPNPTNIFNTTIQIQDRSSNDVTKWFWSSPFSMPSTSEISEPKFAFEQGKIGQYPITLYASNDFGCLDSATIYLNVVSEILFYAPNTFTPNGDEHNQSWKIYTDGIDQYDFELTIYNRWGKPIYETKDPQIGWDGTFNNVIVETGSYNWKAMVKDLYTDDKKVFTGTINVIK